MIPRQRRIDAANLPDARLRFDQARLGYRRLKAAGYRIAIFYFWLNSPQLAVRRVKLRVALGGHDVPADDVRRRYARSSANFIGLYAPLADEWVVYDNSLAGQAVRVADRQGDKLTVKEPETWQRFSPNPPR